jgi:hypothetical protein
VGDRGVIFIALLYFAFAGFAFWALKHVRNKTLRTIGYAAVILVGILLAFSAIVMMIGFKDG